MIKRLHIYTITAIIILSITACSTTEHRIPDWYVKPKPNTASYLYGVGVGLSLDSAKTNALKNITENIRISVESESTFSKTLSLGKLSRSHQDRIKLRSDEITLTGHKIEHSTHINHDYYVMVSVPRDNIINDINNKSQRAINKLKKSIALVNQQSLLDSFIAFNHSSSASNQLSQYDALLVAIDPTYKPDTHKRLIRDFDNHYEDIKKQIVISVISNDRLLPIKQNIDSLFYSQGVLSRASNPDLTVNLSHEKASHEIYNTKVVTIKLTLRLFDKKNALIFSEVIDESGTSIDSFQSAENIAINNLSQAIDGFNFITILGL